MNLLASNYRAWAIKPEDYPSEGTPREQIRYLLGFGVLAPSVHNSQPWKLKFTSETSLRLSPNWAVTLPFSDSTNRGLFMGLGCFIMNLTVAADHFGWKINRTVKGSGQRDTYVELSFSPGRPSLPDELLGAITNRRSHKLLFADKPVPQGLLSELSNIKHGDARIVTASEQGSISAITALHLSSMLEFSGNPNFAREVASWMRASNTKRFDGMPGFTFGLPVLPSVMVKLITKLTPKSVKIVAKKDVAVLSKVSAMGVVVSDGNTPESWINAGTAYQHAGLSAAAKDVFLAPKAAAIEAGHGSELIKYFGASGSPQLYFGIGFGDGVVRHSPRRILGSIDIEGGES